MRVKRVLETCLYADDLKAMKLFYQEILGLNYHAGRADRHVFFRCGDAMLLIFNPARTAKADADVPPHGARGPGHVAFAIPAEEFAAWRQRLKSKSVPIEQEVAWPDGGQSLYFRDPAGNSLELATSATWGISESGSQAATSAKPSSKS